MKRTPRYLFALVFLVMGLLAHAQVYNPDIDVLNYRYTLELNDANNNIKGMAAVDLAFKRDAASFSLDLAKKNSTGKGMTVTSVKEAGKDVRFTQDSDHLIIQTGGATASQHTYLIQYGGIPADGLIISNNKYGHRGFFGDNWPNRAHNWLPCVDHPSDKATLDFFIIAPDHYKVV